MANKQKRKRPHNRVDPEQIAAALALAATRGDGEAAKAFNVSTRSLHRYRAAVRENPTSELAVLVSQSRQQALRQVDDLATSTWEAILTRLKELLPRAQIDDVLKAVEKVGEFILSRRALGVEDDAGTGAGRKAEESPEGEPSAPDPESVIPIRRAAG